MLSSHSFAAKVFSIIEKEWRLDWRNRSSFFSVLLYPLLTVFLVFYAFKELDAITWVVLFWMITLFSAINAMAKSFLQESQGRWAYYYTLFAAEELLIAKLIYNFLLLSLIAGINLILFILFFSFQFECGNLFLLSVLLGVFSFVIIFTIMASISGKASKNASLTAILSLPIIIPLLSVLINFSLKTISVGNTYLFDVALLSAINITLLLLGILLFKFIWKD
jgi:heme exporter protein B